jgi:hypothetical protein
VIFARSSSQRDIVQRMKSLTRQLKRVFGFLIARDVGEVAMENRMAAES